MTSHWTLWVAVVVILSLPKVTEGCFDSDGNFTCATTWYFWFSIFAGFLVLFVTIICVYNLCCKKKTQTGFATPRVLSALERQKRNRTVRPLSGTWYPDAHHHSANQTRGASESSNQGQALSASPAWQLQTNNQITTAHIHTSYPVTQPYSTSVTVSQHV